MVRTIRPAPRRTAPTERTGSSSPLSIPVAPGVDGFNAAATTVVNPSRTTGGTLRLLATGDCDSWDPGRVTFRWCWNLQRLITRTLVGYLAVNGAPFRLGPDLATALGTHNSDYTSWTYTLHPGLTYANGRPIRPVDIEYGMKRSSADKRDGVRAIDTAGNSITFHLSQPNVDFDFLMTEPASAPVPMNGHPLASGPYKISAYRSKRSIAFVRNPEWRQSTDRIRHPLVDSVRLRVVRNPALIDRRLRAGDADARADGGVQAAFRDEILRSRSLREHADDPVLPATRYLALTPAVIPNIHCRRAVFYAWDKSESLERVGGPTAGVPATSMTPPGLKGYDPRYDPYPSGADGRGNVAMAKQELRLCGKPTGFATRIIYDTPTRADRRRFAVDQRALGRVGIKLEPWLLPRIHVWIFTGAPEQLKALGIGLAETSGPADYPTAYGFYEPLLADRLPSVSTDPVIGRVVDGRPHSASDWTRLDRAVMNSALFLPILWEKALYYRNPRLTNVTCDNALASGSYDFVNVGVR